MIEKVNIKNKEELIEEFSSKRDHNTLEGEQYTAGIMVKCATDISNSADGITNSVNEFKKSVELIGKSSENLSRKLFWLNVFLAIATLIGAIATACLFFK